MKQLTWDYVMRFTGDHEGLVLHMYNNKNGGTITDNDVTCGIGIRLPSEESACAPEIKKMFRNKKTNLPATDDELKQDWKTTSGILRTGNVVDKKIMQYYEKCALFMDEALALDRAAETMASRLADTRKPGVCDDLDAFARMPAQAQIAITSFNYGYYVYKTRFLRAAVGQWDFDEAARQVWLGKFDADKKAWVSTKALRKTTAERTLFWNAARIYEQGLDFDQVPLGLDPPALIPWKPWSSQEIDLDKNTQNTVQHGTQPRAPDAEHY